MDRPPCGTNVVYRVFAVQHGEYGYQVLAPSNQVNALMSCPAPAPATTAIGFEASVVDGKVHLTWGACASEHVNATGAATATFASVIAQIMVLDIVFSLDSIITAVGMVDERWVMVTAILISIAFMLMFARPIGDFVEHHPTVKILALSFLIMIGLVLIADGFGQHIPKGYIYAAMAFSVFVELINLWIRKREQVKVAPVKLHERFTDDAPSS